MFLHLFPRTLGIRTPVLPGNQVNYQCCSLFPGGLGFRTPVRKPLVANQLTCVTLHDSYWQLEHFIPYPISPIELVVVLFLFHGLGALMHICFEATKIDFHYHHHHHHHRALIVIVDVVVVIVITIITKQTVQERICSLLFWIFVSLFVAALVVAIYFWRKYDGTRLPWIFNNYSTSARWI